MPGLVRVTLVSWAKKSKSTAQKRQEYFLKEGRCPTCGIHTHEKKAVGVFNRIELVPIRNDSVKDGRCLMCAPLPQEAVLVTNAQTSDSPAEPQVHIAHPVPLSQQQSGTGREQLNLEGDGNVVVVDDSDSDDSIVGDDAFKAENDVKKVSPTYPLKTAPLPPPKPPTRSVTAPEAAEFPKEDLKRRRERLQAKRAKVALGCGAVFAVLAASIVTVLVMFRDASTPASAPTNDSVTTSSESAAPTLPTVEAPTLPTAEAPTLPTTEAPTLPTTESPSLLIWPAPTASPARTNRATQLRRVISTISEEDTLNDQWKPQYKAFQWMVGDDARQAEPLTEEWAILQRYTMALFYFATGGEYTWTQPRNFLSDGHECQWHPNVNCVASPTIPSNQNGRRVTQLQFEGGSQRIYNDVGATGISGQIPDEIALALPYLQEVGIIAEQLGGTLPSNFDKLKYLDYMDLSQNVGLHGTIPESFGALPRLEGLVLTETKIGGTIPTTLGQLSTLEYLWLGWNFLTSTIPTQLGLLSKLRILNLQNNELTGTVPSELGNLKKLRTLTLQRNDLSGTVPESVCGLSEMQPLRRFTLDCLEVQCNCCEECG